MNLSEQRQRPVTSTTNGHGGTDVVWPIPHVAEVRSPIRAAQLSAVKAAHPSSARPGAVRSAPLAVITPEEATIASDENGSLVTEYGLLAVVAATIAGVVIQWASGGALVSLFNALLRHARSLVGA